MVMLAVLMSQPRMRLKVLKEASPFSTLEVDTKGRCGVPGGSLKMVCKCVRSLFRVLVCHGFCAMTMKSSM
jgi:hypothetical protein